jgi:hypothetical protein
MDHRSTEAFAREVEAAALRAQGLREEAIRAFWDAVAARLGAALRTLRARLVRRSRADTLFPEA